MVGLRCREAAADVRRPDGRDDQGGQIRNIRNVPSWRDELVPQAEAGADDGGVEAAGGLEAVAEDVGGGAGGGAGLVADDGSAAGQRLVQGGDAAVEGDEGYWFGALGQRDAGPGGQVLHGGDARDGLHRHPGHQLADGLGKVAEGRVEVGVAERAERDRGGARGELLRHRGGGRLPGRGPPRRDAAGVVEGELQAPDAVGGDVRADDGFCAAGFRVRGGQHGDQHHVGLAEHADGLDRDQLGISGADAHADQPAHGAAALAQAAVNLAAAAGWPAQWVCR